MVASSSRSPAWKEDVKSVADDSLLGDEGRSGGAVSSTDASAMNVDAKADAAVSAFLRRRVNKPGLSTEKIQWKTRLRCHVTDHDLTVNEQEQ